MENKKIEHCNYVMFPRMQDHGATSVLYSQQDEEDIQIPMAAEE